MVTAVAMASISDRSPIMKSTAFRPRRIAAALLTLAALGSSAAAFAQDASPAGKTRAQVQEELVQAEAQGIVPSSRGDYPPSAYTIARNRVLYQIHTGGDAAPAESAITSN
jgi:hypothetical protein